jgi:polysaccharide biosynthesis protein PslH
MHVTIIDSDVSYPMTSGKRLRTMNLILPLAKTHQLTYIGRSESTAQAREGATFLADHGIAPVMVHAPLQQKQGARLYFNLAKNLASPLPYSVTSHVHAAMRAAAQRQSSAGEVDLWQVEWLGYNYCVAGLPGPVVIQAHNVESLIWKRYGETESNPARRMFVRQQWRKFERFEREAFLAADRVLAVSTADADLARNLYGPVALDVVDNGVDINGFSGLAPRPGSSQILFLGALDWRPNIDALDLLLGTIFPAVRANNPRARLAVVGRHPSPALRQRIEMTAGAELHADVPDVKPFLQSSAVMAVPLRIGGGSRLKILEALAAGLPVVSTGVGAEGLEIEDGIHYVKADTASAMSAALVAALADTAIHFKQAAAGRLAVAARYDWPMLAARLERSWEAAVRSHAAKKQRLIA